MVAGSVPRTRVVEGVLGPIEGFEDDEVVFGRYARHGCYAPGLLDLLCGLLARGGTLLDVGAHIGLVSLGVARRCPAQVVAFEPARDSAALLRRNVARSELGGRVQVHACALDARGGSAQLVRSADNSGDHHLLSTFESAPGASAQSVPTTTLDDALAGQRLAAPVVLKLDTQGSEARVLRGATRTLPQVAHAVVEYWPFGLHRMGEPPGALDVLLAEAFPYAAVLLDDEPIARLPPMAQTLHRLSWIARDGSDEGFFDLLLSRSPTPLAGC